MADHQALTELLGAEVDRAGALESLVAQLATRPTTAVAVPAAVAEPAELLSTEVFLQISQRHLNEMPRWSGDDDALNEAEQDRATLVAARLALSYFLRQNRARAAAAQSQLETMLAQIA